MNAIDELRSLIPPYVSGDDIGGPEDDILCNVKRIADRIEAEWMELPKDADGVPCKRGDHVRLGETEGTIKEMLWYERGWELYLTTLDDSVAADSLRHVRPEPPDSQERIDQDAGKGPCEYFGHDGMSCSDGGECRAASSHDRCHTCQRLDLLARQRKLDGVSE